MIPSLLIANRSEIACRIIRTARRLGVRTVAVYSDADRNALHVRQADEAVHIGPSPARESYLRGDRIIEAAKATGAEGIHPGYGFLSENADFAQAVIDAGLVWVGPKPDSIRAMGLKDAAKKLMADAGVPVTPGYLGEDQDPQRLKQEADAIGYPVLIKAVAGGGGKGMRRVDEAGAFIDALESCKREAVSSFGDDRVIIEKYILSPRHIEVQVFGDSHGNVVHLFERDCSLQRRHQKVIEEAPAPGMDEATREAVCAAAVRAAQAVNYEGAGTIEFIADASDGLKADRIWFMEMNTRLQVEHPVTEEITGQDLVEWQLRVASGQPLPKTQDELTITGHAIEARLYAEDPAKGFLPSVGVLEQFYVPTHGSRFDTGFEEGDRVSPFYDPMLGKIVNHGRDRATAIEAMLDDLNGTLVFPVKSNAGFAWRCIADADFQSGRIDTGFIARKGDDLIAPALPSQALIDVAAAAEILEWQRYDDVFPEYLSRDLSGFRLNAPRAMSVAFKTDTGQVLGTATHAARQRQFETLTKANPDRVLVVENGHTFELRQRATGGMTAAAADGVIIAPMPGKLTSVEVAAGDKVTKGQRLLTLEAMKMEHGMVAPFDGVVAELFAEEGAQVADGAVLVKVEPRQE